MRTIVHQLNRKFKAFNASSIKFYCKVRSYISILEKQLIIKATLKSSRTKKKLCVLYLGLFTAPPIDVMRVVSRIIWDHLKSSQKAATTSVAYIEKMHVVVTYPFSVIFLTTWLKHRRCVASSISKKCTPRLYQLHSYRQNFSNYVQRDEQPFPC